MLIETRGEGGYTILAPSNGRVHPSGGAWSLEAGGFGTIAALSDEERDALFGLARTFDRLPAAPRAERTASGDGDRPGDRYNQRADIAQRTLDLLDEYGWTHVYTRADGVHLLRRPGKDVGTSATLTASGAFTCFSTSVTEFEHRRGHSPFDVYAILVHGGDWSAAAAALAEQEGIHFASDDPEPVAATRGSLARATRGGRLPRRAG